MYPHREQLIPLTDTPYEDTTVYSELAWASV